MPCGSPAKSYQVGQHYEPLQEIRQLEWDELRGSWNFAATPLNKLDGRRRGQIFCDKSVWLRTVIAVSRERVNSVSRHRSMGVDVLRVQAAR